MLLDGDARTRPRSHATLRVHFGIVRPFIQCWAATRGHLREITSGDVDTVLEPLRGHRPYNAITALRSLFRFAKRRGLTFADPTRHLSGGRGPGRTVLPMTAEEIRAAGQAAVTPAQRLAIALAAVHAARPKAIRELTLDDIDLPSLAHHHRRSPAAARRAHLQRPAGLARIRRATWPDTANRHVLVSRISALGTRPVSPDYLDKHQPRGVCLEHIRRDRILHEALATGADLLHLSLVFNIDHANAMAYASAARSLLDQPGRAGCPRPPGTGMKARRAREPGRGMAVTEGEHPAKAATGCSRRFCAHGDQLSATVHTCTDCPVRPIGQPDRTLRRARHLS